MKTAPLSHKLPLHALLAGTAVAACNLGLPAANAAGFLDFNNGNWTISAGGTTCPDGEDYVDCVVNNQASSLEMFGPDAELANLKYTSETVPAGSRGYTITGFNYSFDNRDDLHQAYYRIGGTTTFLADTGGGSTYKSVLATLGAEEDFEFGVGNKAGVTTTAYLQITNFTYAEVPVPAPLPLLGAGASFAWIRRRRSMLKAASLRKAHHPSPTHNTARPLRP